MPISNTRRLSVSLRATLALCLFPVITPTAGAATPAVPALQVAGAAGTHHYTIPPQPLYSALDALAEQAGLQLVYSAELVQAIDSPGLTGDYTPEDALTRLLAGTGLAYRYTGPDTVTLARLNPLDALLAKATKPRQYAGATEPAPKKPDAPPQEDADEVTVLPPLTVTGDPWGDTSYNALDATTATKTDTPIMETPFSVQVVPQQVLKDQQAFRLDQALRNVSGVYAHPFGIFNSPGEVFNLRGFVTSNQYRNGFRLENTAGQLETANLDRIEVLKGPASILYGRLEPGGLINLVSKQPLATPYYSLQQQLGSFDFYRTTLDATGPIAKDHGLFYRFNLAYENAGSFVEFVDNERVFIAPTLRWEISSATQATFELQYKHSRDPRLRGFPAIGDRPADLPRGSNNLGEPVGDEAKTDNVLFSFDWSHAFNDRWTLRHRFYGDWTDGGENLIGVGFLDSDGRGVRDFVSTEFPTDTYATSLDLTGKFDTWGLRHTLLSGVDYFNHQRSFDPVVFSFIPSPIDIFNPTHGGEIGSFLARFEIDFKEHWYGFYLQDQVQLPYHFHLLAGFRYDNATTRNLRDNFPTADAQTPGSSEKSEAKDESVNPRFGLLWQPVPELSLYGNYVENFGLPNLSLVAGNTQLLPQTAQQWEVGLKTELFDGRMTGTLAWFNLTKQNITTSDPFNPGFSRLTGEARNQGLELDVAGEILPGWQMIGVYSYIDSEITKDREDAFGNPIGNQGHRFFNVPRHGGSLWTTYEIQQGLFKGLKLGAGVVGRSERQGDNENSFQLPGYAIGNLLVGYERKVGPSKVTVQLNVENLTDETYFAGAQAFRDLANFFGAPRTFLGSVRVEF